MLHIQCILLKKSINFFLFFFFVQFGRIDDQLKVKICKKRKEKKKLGDNMVITNTPVLQFRVLERKKKPKIV